MTDVAPIIQLARDAQAKLDSLRAKRDRLEAEIAETSRILGAFQTTLKHLGHDLDGPQPKAATTAASTHDVGGLVANALNTVQGVFTFRTIVEMIEAIAGSHVASDKVVAGYVRRAQVAGYLSIHRKGEGRRPTEYVRVSQ